MLSPQQLYTFLTLTLLTGSFIYSDLFIYRYSLLHNRYSFIIILQRKVISYITFIVTYLLYIGK